MTNDKYIALGIKEWSKVSIQCPRCNESMRGYKPFEMDKIGEYLDGIFGCDHCDNFYFLDGTQLTIDEMEEYFC